MTHRSKGKHAATIPLNMRNSGNLQSQSSQNSYSRLTGINDQGRSFLKIDSTVTSKGSDNVSGSNTASNTADVITVNLDDIRARLHRLHHYAHQQISSLPGSAKEDHNALVQYMKLLYDTDAYKIYHDEVRHTFGDLTHVQPGTVGAYFIGCVLSSSVDKLPGCSVICAGSMPLPRQNNTPNDSFCPHSVVIALPSGNGYEFKTLHEGENKNNLIVYISSKSNFTGFSDEEKAQLAKYGASNITVRRYLPDGKTYVDLNNGVSRIDQLPSRVDVITSPTPSASNGSLMIILLIILVIIAVFIGWRIWSSKS